MGNCIRCAAGVLALAFLAPAKQYDVVVYGATPSGIAAAINAGSAGRSVLLIEPSRRIGGMVTHGLSFTDYRTLASLGGAFRDYADRVLRHYRDTYGANSKQAGDSLSGTLAEPKVSLRVFEEMIGEQRTVEKLMNHRLRSVSLGMPRDGHKVIRGITLEDLASGKTLEISGRFFIDSTYEGDLAAFAGAPYRVGRESTREYGERFAGLIYYFDGRILPGSTGEADRRVQCYNYRVLMTRDPGNRAPVSKPARYNREEYLPVLAAVRSGRLKEIFTVDATGILRIQWLPNGKADINDIKNAPVRLSLPGENNDWPDGSPEVRQRILERHKDYTLGLLWFVQNDPELPETMRAPASEWGLAKDEFEDTGNFPPMIYVREARRILGEYVFREQDALMAPGEVRPPLREDSIAIGDYSLNCHGEQKPGPLHPHVTEGDYGFGTAPFQVPYGVLVPKTMDNLLVTVAVSATHVGYSCLRLEPTYTAMGQAAGVAAHVALRDDVAARKVRVPAVQELLWSRGAMTFYFSDVEKSSPRFRAAQYAGTRGYFHGLVDLERTVYTAYSSIRGGQHAHPVGYYNADLDRPVDERTTRIWEELLAKSGPARARTAVKTGLTRGAVLDAIAEASLRP